MRKHWVTTLMGALAAAANLVGNYVLSSGKILWSNIILSFFLFAIGAFAADYRQVDKVKK